MLTFKFLHPNKQYELSFLRLKDANNRNVMLNCRYISYVDFMTEQPERARMLQFRGNILEFYNHIKEQRSPDGYEVIPTIYEMRLSYRGVIERAIKYSNYRTTYNFIARKYYLVINYRIMANEIF
jgi:hypothetical protein